jgi:hypothetical protein
MSDQITNPPKKDEEQKDKKNQWLTPLLIGLGAVVVFGVLGYIAYRWQRDDSPFEMKVSKEI